MVYFFYSSTATQLFFIFTWFSFQAREREIELDAEYQKLEADRAVAAAEEARSARERREEAERNRQLALLDQIETVRCQCHL